MRTVKLSAFFLLCIPLILLTGCDAELKDLKIQNDTQRKQIADLNSQVQTSSLQIDQLNRQLADANEKSSINEDALKQQVDALEENLQKKNELIASMQDKLLTGVVLPVELSTMLGDFAKQQPELVTFDEDRGIVRFKSDLLFEKGSDTVTSGAVGAIKSLCAILNSEQGKEFDIIIAGHTDDIPILKPDTKAKHPTNWHLSAHRAISVLDIMAVNNIEQKRMSVRGFGEYRPVAPNKPNKEGNPQNRRVEIYIVPKGV
jgi:chemotaxis protein MotB